MAVFTIDICKLKDGSRDFYCPTCGQLISLGDRTGVKCILHVQPKTEPPHLLVECLHCGSRIKVTGIRLDLQTPEE